MTFKNKLKPTVMKRENSFLPKKAIRAAIVFFGLLCSNYLFAQSTITGVVSDNKGAPMKGVTILKKGTKVGTSTADNGTFSIVASPKDILVFTSVGYGVKEIAVDRQTNLSVSLQTVTAALDEVVVVGYGAVKKRDLTGSVAVVNVADAKKTATYDVAKMLQGQAAGVSVQGSGEPGGFVQIKIRGISTFGDNSPLFVIDGVPVVSPFDFNTDDIETIQV